MSSRTPAFGISMRLALAVPPLAATGAWCVDWLLEFPPRSAASLVTAIVMAVAAVVLLFPVPIAVSRLIGYPTNRSLRNIALTAVASLYWSLGVAIIVSTLS